MGQIIQEIIEDFTEGITDDPRRRNVGLSQIVTNFDIFTSKRRAIPYPDSEDGDTAAATSQKQIFDIGLWTPTTPDEWRLFSLGVVSGTGRAEILMKTLTTGGSADLSDNTWSAPAGNASGSGSTSFNLFKYYKTTGKFYGAKAGTTIWIFTPDGATAFDDSGHSLAYTTIGQGIVHSKDDILYIPYDNKIARNNNGSWTDAALTIPSHMYITCISEYGNYIAVAAAPLAGVGKSRVYLWDRDASLATLSQMIDWGEGVLTTLDELEGWLVGISIAGNSSTRVKNRVIFRKSDGIRAKKFLTLVAPTSNVVTLLSTRQKADDRIYFMMSISIDGVVREGVWSIGISNSGELALSNERTPNNDTAVTSGGGLLKGFFVVGDFMFISYINASSDYALSKTNDQATYTAKCIYESTIKNKGDSDLIGALVGASLMFEPMPNGGGAALSYKKDAETGWTRLFTYTSQNKISHGAVNIESDSTAFTVTIASPGVFTLTNHGLIAGQKIKLRTTGALPTGLTAGVEYYVLSAGLTTSVFKLSLTDGGTAINTSGSQSGVHTIDRTYKLTEGKEFKFRGESTGGTVITGLKYKMEILDKQLY